jgi:hypothetical protein
MTARQIAASGGREMIRPALGAAVDQLSDAELVDSFYYTVFPNFHPWGAYNRITYRFRPYGTEVDQSIMECMYLGPFQPGERPPAAKMRLLGPDDDWTEAPELGFLARVFNQDTFNLPKVQLGLKATARKPSRSRTTRKPSCATFIICSISGSRGPDAAVAEALSLAEEFDRSCNTILDECTMPWYITFRCDQDLPAQGPERAGLDWKEPHRSSADDGAMQNPP